jgi:hypothetical protein
MTSLIAFFIRPFRFCQANRDVHPIEFARERSDRQDKNDRSLPDKADGSRRKSVSFVHNLFTFSGIVIFVRL